METWRTVTVIWQNHLHCKHNNVNMTMRSLPLSPSTTMSTEECKHSYCGEYKEITYDTLYNSRTVYCEKVTLVFKEICNHLLNSSTYVQTAAVGQDFQSKTITVWLDWEFLHNFGTWSTICPQCPLAVCRLFWMVLTSLFLCSTLGNFVSEEIADGISQWITHIAVMFYSS